jgi:Protein of unknown function (DUF3995)
MSMLLAATSSGILLVAALFHIYWGLGGKAGIDVSVPQTIDGRPFVNPHPLATFSFGVILLIVLALMLSIFGAIKLPLPFGLVKMAVGAWACLCFARALSWHKYVGLFKSVRTTSFGRYDTWLYSPLCLWLAVGMGYGLYQSS